MGIDEFASINSKMSLKIAEPLARLANCCHLSSVAFS